jgi:hypothetical protein
VRALFFTVIYKFGIVESAGNQRNGGEGERHATIYRGNSFSSRGRRLLWTRWVESSVPFLQIDVNFGLQANLLTVYEGCSIT